MGNPIPHEISKALQLKDLQDSIVDKNFAKVTIELASTPDGGHTPVITNRKSNVHPGVIFGHEAGPVGDATTVEEGAVILGALYRRIHVGKNAEIGKKARIGSFADRIGKIVVEEEAKVGPTVRIFSPGAGQTTVIGARAVIGRGSTIGHKAKPVVGTNSTSRGFGGGVEIGEGAILGNRTVVEHGVTIGEGAEVGGGYVLTSGLVVPDGISIYENLDKQPVRITQKWLEQYLADPVLN